MIATDIVKEATQKISNGEDTIYLIDQNDKPITVRSDTSFPHTSFNGAETIVYVNDEKYGNPINITYIFFQHIVVKLSYIHTLRSTIMDLREANIEELNLLLIALKGSNPRWL